jgi:hypothetical protein
MDKFKVGDVVRCMREFPDCTPGMLGVVIGEYAGATNAMYIRRETDNRKCAVYERDFELYNPDQPKLIP